MIEKRIMAYARWIVIPRLCHNKQRLFQLPYRGSLILPQPPIGQASPSLWRFTSGDLRFPGHGRANTSRNTSISRLLTTMADRFSDRNGVFHFSDVLARFRMLTMLGFIFRTRMLWFAR
jgi:hypothetical protein